MAYVRAAGAMGSATNRALITWLEPADTYDAIRIVWRLDTFATTPTGGQDINGATHHDCTPEEIANKTFEHGNLAALSGQAIAYSIFAGNAGTWGSLVIDNSYAEAVITQLIPVQVHGYVLDVNGDPLPDGTKVFITRTTPTVFELRTGGTSANNFALVQGGDGFFDFTNYFTNVDGSNDNFFAGDNLHIIIKDASDVVLYEYDHIVTAREITAYGGPSLDSGTALTLQPEPEPNQLPMPPQIVVYNPTEPDINPSPIATATPSFVWQHSEDLDATENAGKVDYAIEYSSAELPATPAPHESTPPTYYLHKTTIQASRAYFQYREKVDGAWGAWTDWGTDTEGYKLVAGTEAQVRFTVPTETPLSEGTWYWRVYVTDRTLA